MSKMKNSRKILAILCTFTVAASMLAGCVGSSSTGTAGQSAVSVSSPSSEVSSSQQAVPVELSLIEPDMGRVLKEDNENPPLKALEEDTNTILNITLVPQAEFTNKYNVLASSGDIPDITRLNGFNYQLYADQGLFMDIESYLNEYGPDLLENVSEQAWNLIKYKDKVYVVPYENVAGKYCTFIRQDWLDNLNLEMPKTLDEYKKVLEAFTFDDPDKNGANDTYGMGACGGWSGDSIGVDFDGIFGAFGFARGSSCIKDNKVYSSMTSDEYRNAIEFIKELWDEKVIDPEIFTIKQDQARQKMVQGKSGTVTAWWSTSSVYMQQLKMGEINPDAKWNPVYPAITDNDGKGGGYQSQGSIGGTVSISAKCKNPEAAIQFLNYLSTKEGWLLTNKGIQGEDWTEFGTALTEQGQKALDEKWLDPLSQIVSRQDLAAEWRKVATDEITVDNNKYIDASGDVTLYSSVFYGVPTTDEEKTFGADLAKYQLEMFTKFVTGAEELTDATWQSYVDTCNNAKGGQKIFEAQIKAYNEIKGTSYTAGN